MPNGDTPQTLGEIIARAFATAHGRSHDGTVQPGDNTSMYITDMHPLIPPAAPEVPITPPTPINPYQTNPGYSDIANLPWNHFRGNRGNSSST